MSTRLRWQSDRTRRRIMCYIAGWVTVLGVAEVGHLAGWWR